MWTRKSCRSRVVWKTRCLLCTVDGIGVDDAQRDEKRVCIRKRQRCIACSATKLTFNYIYGAGMSIPEAQKKSARIHTRPRIQRSLGRLRYLRYGVTYAKGCLPNESDRTICLRLVLSCGVPPHADRIDGIPHLGARRIAVPRQRRQVLRRAGIGNLKFVDESNVSIYMLGMEDSPQEIAFSSAVDVDKKEHEVAIACVTPSQPVPIPPEDFSISRLCWIKREKHGTDS